ncbi:MAG TPA: hypothetical protein VN761_10970 [Candidatus Polarisedimenticolia bacterium]|jgi:hypothetical protein|nr:hypothetical protein [Candidatus Polarisedimenticolia bacterium]
MRIKPYDSKLANTNRRHHVIISGTGRTGTTFLVQLLTELGLETGFSNPNAQICDERRAGMEWRLRKSATAPYIVKNPALCDQLEGILKNENVTIDHAIIPIRDLYSAAESRRVVARKRPKFLIPRKILGIKKWGVRRPDEQESVLAQNFYRLVHTIAEHNIPMTLLFFPRLAKDPEYLFGKINFLLKGFSYEKFVQAFQKISRPDLIHDFASKAPLAGSSNG